MSDQFRDFAAGLGYELPPSIEPGRRFRFSTNGKRGDLAGWGILFADGLGGVVGDWRSGQSETWQAKRGRLSADEYRELQAKIDRERREAQAERERDATEAAALAAQIWEASKPAAADHPYLKSKDVQAYGLRIYSGPELETREGKKIDVSGALILPLRNAEGVIRSLEFIQEDGGKLFLPGSSYRGCYYAIGQPGDVLCILEGFATGATIHKQTGYPVRIAATAGNLEEVARAIRAKAQQARLIVCADNDLQTVCQKHKQEGITTALDPLQHRPEWCRCNPGVTYALVAARAAGGLLAIPTPEAGTDFNDLHAEGGDVKAQVEAARVPPMNGAVAGPSSDIDAQSAGWSDPEPLPELPEVPSFNFDVLPGPLRGFVNDIAERMSCPPEFPAVGAVVMAGAAIGRKVGIRPMRHDHWTVIPNVWGAIVGMPGIKKSPALADAIAPLHRMQAKAFEEYETAKSDFEIQERAAKIRSQEAEKKARETYAKDRGANIAAMLKPEADLEEPKQRRYIVNDTSPEALCETLEENPNGVLVERDELIGLLKAMDKEGNQESRALYLTAADGNKSHITDRIGRGRGRHIPALCVSMLGGIQPGPLAAYVRETQKGGVGDDGLLQRFGMLVYPDLGKWKLVDRKPDIEAKHAAHALIERLCTMTTEQAGAEIDPYSEVPFLHFDASAQALFNEWLTDLEGRIRSGEDHPAITSHLAKYRKTAPALALINHLCDGGVGPVSEAALGRALLFVELLEAHARRVYSYAARPDLNAAKTILAKLKAGKLPIEFDARRVYRAGWSGLTTPEEVYPALRALTDYGYLRERTNTDTGGKHSTVYRAHPSAKGAA